MASHASKSIKFEGNKPSIRWRACLGRISECSVSSYFFSSSTLFVSVERHKEFQMRLEHDRLSCEASVTNSSQGIGSHILAFLAATKIAKSSALATVCYPGTMPAAETWKKGYCRRSTNKKSAACLTCPSLTDKSWTTDQVAILPDKCFGNLAAPSVKKRKCGISQFLGGSISGILTVAMNARKLVKCSCERGKGM